MSAFLFALRQRFRALIQAAVKAREDFNLNPYAERTLFRSLCANCRSIMLGGQPCSFGIVDAIAPCPTIFLRREQPPGTCPRRQNSVLFFLLAVLL
jgi:hypothetical protein